MPRTRPLTIVTLVGLIVHAHSAYGSTQQIFATDSLNDQVMVIDSQTLDLTATIPVQAGSSSIKMAVTKAGLRAFVSSDNTMTVIDAKDKRLLFSRQIGIGGPMAVSPDGTRLYIARAGIAPSVAVFDTVTLDRIAWIDVCGLWPGDMISTRGQYESLTQLAANPTDGEMYVYCQTRSRLEAIDIETHAVTRKIDALLPDTTEVAVSHDGTRAYGIRWPNVSAIDLQADRWIGGFRMEERVSALAYSPDGTRVYASNYGSGWGNRDVSVTAIDAASHSIFGINDIPWGATGPGLQVGEDGTVYTVYRSNVLAIRPDRAPLELSRTNTVAGWLRHIALTPSEYCSDGVVNGAEECDDRNRYNDDGCSETCLLEGCGNGRIDPFELTDECPLAEIVSPIAKSQLDGFANMTFTWNDTGAKEYWFTMGRSQGGGDIVNASRGTATSAVVSRLPNTGEQVWVRLWTFTTRWGYVDTWFDALNRPPSRIISPAPNERIAEPGGVTFAWTDIGADSYWLSIGSAQGERSYHDAEYSGTSATMQMPNDGQQYWVRVWSMREGVWEYTDSTFRTWQWEFRW